MHARRNLVRERDVDLRESGCSQPFEILRSGEGAGDAADVRAAITPIGRAEVVLGDDVGDADAATAHEDAEHLAEHRRLVC